MKWDNPPARCRCYKNKGEKIMASGTMKLHTYLNYGGNCEEAFRFYEKHLGGKITMMMTQGQQPGAKDVPPEMENTILYTRMTIGETELMASDVPPERFQPMRSAYLSLTVPSSDQAERIYALLSDGGQVFMPMQETFFAFRFGMLRDKFGTSWMIIHERPMAPKE
jgi:PhnB protein